MMPGAELAQHGIAVFSVAGVIYIVSLLIKQWKVPSKTNEANKELSVDVLKVVDNNTKAIKEMTDVIQTFQVSLARQEQKIDELLSRARK